MSTLFKSTMAKVQAKIQEEGSIRSFAQRLDLNPTTISRWFAEQRSPDFQALCVILEYFGARILFPGDKEPSPVPNDKPEPLDTTPQKPSQSAKENARLRKEIEVLRTERDLARGQAQALKEQIERLAPTHGESLGMSSRETCPGTNNQVRGIKAG